MADLASLLHSPQFFCCLASAAGSFVTAALSENLPPRRRVGNFMASGLIGVYMAPAVTFWWFPKHDYTTPIPYSVSFVVGAVGVSLYPLVLKLLSTKLRSSISEKP